ncbi:hypothetical protein IGI04_007311 [Brassica rapa subsp. trilocularis]|uniref:Uncharacterized protein n=1 Tax=Brassica rapa subsp. trilocularis TaxID=1813537 RepID=A0ABQ7NJE5_BRACM|nr:hypothetical protein IGI04_007311 [Brassica rapa subsp. trilocularis]
MNLFASTDALLSDCSDTTISIDVQYNPSIDITFYSTMLTFFSSWFQMSSSETNARNRELRSKRRFDETSSSSNPQRHPWPCPENTPFDAFLRNPRNMSRRPPSIHRTRAQDAQAPPLPDFPNIPDIPMQDQGDFQRFVVDALQAIWARVSCRSRRTTGAQAPAPAARRNPSPEEDEETDEDTD